MHDVKEFFSGDAHLNEEGVALYVDALKLKKVERLPGPIREHVASCQLCRKNVTGLFSLLADQDYSFVRKHPFLDAESATRAPVRRSAYRIAAALAAAIGVGVLAYYVVSVNNARESLRTVAQQEGAEKDTVTHPPEQTGPMREQDLYAANFTPLPELEDMVGNTFRSSEVEVTSPNNGATYAGDIRFDWKSPGPLTLVVMDNRGKNVLERRVVKPPFVMEKLSRRGLYYWKLQTAEELVYVGKFVVR